MNTIVYGIKNCDTMKKAFKWLDEHEIEYSFHDYKKSGVDLDILKHAIQDHGWEDVINRRGTSWRKLDDTTKTNMNAEKAIIAAQENPSLIKRPLLVHNAQSYLGFKADQYSKIFSK